jgi:hypothetical protein
MDVRAPTHELIRARAVLRARRRIAEAKPDWALSAAGLAGLRGRGGRACENEARDRDEGGDERIDLDGENVEADAVGTARAIPVHDQMADVFAAVDVAIAQADRTLACEASTSGALSSKRPAPCRQLWRRRSRPTPGAQSIHCSTHRGSVDCWPKACCGNAARPARTFLACTTA